MTESDSCICIVSESLKSVYHKTIRGPENGDDLVMTMSDVGTWPQTSFQSSDLASTGHTEVTNRTGES